MKLVSAIMPTRGRQEWARQAFDSFMAQTYPMKQLVILDDLEDPSFPGLFDGTQHIKYISSWGRLHIPIKRNKCCGHADGSIIVHWDSDDYSSPDRIASQVELLESSGKSVAGFHSMLFYDERDGQLWKYHGLSNYALGTSLCYTRDWWQAHPFRQGVTDPNVGEDNLFMGEARDRGQLVTADAGALMTARIHAGSTSPHDLGPTQMEYRRVSVDALPEGFPR